MPQGRVRFITLTPKMWSLSGGVAAEEVSSAIGRYGPYLYQEHVQAIETPFRIGDFFSKRDPKRMTFASFAASLSTESQHRGNSLAPPIRPATETR